MQSKRYKEVGTVYIHSEMKSLTDRCKFDRKLEPKL